MSYAYKIKLDRLSGEVSESGTWRPALMSILDECEMNDLFRVSLLEQGWISKDETRNLLQLEIDGVSCEYDSQLNEIKANLIDEVHVDHTVVVDSDDSASLKESRLAEGQRQQAQKLRDRQEMKARELTERLLNLEQQIKEQIDLASHSTHAKALKRRAERLGEIKSSQESVREDGTLEITIHVELKS